MVLTGLRKREYKWNLLTKKTKAEEEKEKEKEGKESKEKTEGMIFDFP